MNEDPIMNMDAWKAAHPDAAAKREAQERTNTDAMDIKTSKTLNEVEDNGADASEENETESEPSIFPSDSDRPQYVVLDDWAEDSGRKYKPGVYYCGMSKGKGKGEEPPQPFNTWFAGPLHIDALTRDTQDNNFGRLLRFKNDLGHWREWAMPMELLSGSGEDMRGSLLSMGLTLDPHSARTYLSQYIQWRIPKRKVLCAMQTGWAGKSFVLPDCVIGPNAAGVVFQSGERSHDEYTQAGTIDQWRAEISARALGNPLLVLALSASFAGPLLAKCNTEGGGVHFVGDSSSGKTTAIEAACSVWGSTNFKRSWRATANGMEGAAVMFNDCLLALDEISECDPREVGAIVYTLGNGTGKQRATRSGSAKNVTRWRCFVLSSGERTITTTMDEGGHKAKAGQTMRLLDIPVARTYGAWDNLHGMDSGTMFSDAIKRAAATHYGHAGQAFLESLTRDERDLCELLMEVKNHEDFKAEGMEGQDKRAIGRFAIMALAGELATEYGITEWPAGEAIKAAVVGFEAWQSMRGKGNDERRRILECLSDFIDQYGDGKFSDIEAPNDGLRVLDRAGYWRNTSYGREYLFNAKGIRSALKGFDFKRSITVLQEQGVLDANGDNGQIRLWVDAKQIRVYPIRHERLEGY